jgi:putative endopeptidase
MGIGHEITHAFDDSGAEFDGHGNLVFWWEQEDYDAFSELSAAVSDQYGDLELASGLSVNGDLTLGENIADLGGLQAAYDGLVMALDDAGTSITKEQQREFFIANAQLWRSISTPEHEEWLLLNDPHSPGAVRAVQPLRNMDAFHEAFDITRTDDEYLPPTDRIVIW